MTNDNLIPSSSVIVLRESRSGFEVLLVRRNSKINFYGGSWVYPGGKIDPEDIVESNDPFGQEAAVAAATREADEEVSLQLDPTKLHYFTHWTTPNLIPKRFSTWFFLTVLEDSQQVKVDGEEIVDHRWVSIPDALKARHNQEIQLPPPTFVNLLYIQQLKRLHDFSAFVDHHKPNRFEPVMTRLDTGMCSIYQEDIAYNDQDLTKKGERHRLLMLNDRWTYQNTVRPLRKFAESSP